MAPPFGSGPPWAPPGYVPQGVPPAPPPNLNTAAAPSIAPYVYSPAITHFCDVTAATSHTFSANAPAGGALVLFVYANTITTTVSGVKDNFGSLWSVAVTSHSDGDASCTAYYCANLAGANPSITITLSSSKACMGFAIPVAGASPQWFLDGAGFHIKATGDTTSFPPVRSVSPGDIFVTAWSGTAAPNTNPANCTTQAFVVPAAILSDTNVRIAWSNAPVVANTQGPSWGNSAGNPNGTMTVAIRAAGVYPSQLAVYPTAVLAGVPSGPLISSPPAYVETLVPASAPSFQSTPYSLLAWASSRLPEPEADYQRVNHQSFFAYPQTTVASPAYLGLRLWQQETPPTIPEADTPRTNTQALFSFISPPSAQRFNAFALYVRSQSAQIPDEVIARTDNQTYFRFISQTQVSVPSPALALFKLSYRAPEIEGEYQRANHQLYFEFLQPAPVIITGAAPVLPTGALLPGKPPALARQDQLGQGMGPYKRPGQVFGEPDPVSPRMSSRAITEAVHAVLAAKSLERQGTDQELAIALLLALEETQRR